MNVLLDTHTFIWYIEGNASLTEKAKDTIEFSANNVYLSIISLWEIAITANTDQTRHKRS